MPPVIFRRDAGNDGEFVLFPTLRIVVCSYQIGPTTIATDPSRCQEVGLSLSLSLSRARARVYLSQKSWTMPLAEKGL